VRVLLDTHIYLWWLNDSPQLSQAARTIIREAETVYISSASLWEAVIKIGLGKLEADPAELAAGIRESGFESLPITAEHTLALPGLANHHKDPFDRMLIAQAISEPLHLVTIDGVMSAYSELVIQV
jgi:PIN domain nuclease of toxin-antitoxin system